MQDERPHLDLQALQRLEHLGGRAFVLKMIDLFNSYAGDKVAAARQAQAAGDLAGVQKAVHPIKSSAGNVGASSVQALAEQLEQSARQGQTAVVAELLAQLEQGFSLAKDALEQQKQALINRTP
jgi:HPt (histidine-containing phosphotransfer) domain-containing protein